MMMVQTNNNAGILDFRPVFDTYAKNTVFQAKAKRKSKFGVYQFDYETFIVFDRVQKREICVCSNYDNLEDARQRARKIAALLNASGG
jgi:hypothetical protein